ncbi:glycosyltransferase [uncultured Microbulbifer sp.]|uniref:glycosyltransferase n=1 Tax=uncultured Microbulbifer sp. TaxID=348147 RepID=UPI002638D5C1|nr:glycosyltransferase [uncultured Microbulbifer sp.]
MQKKELAEDPLRLGFVVIGRNEGDRLKNCLRSIVDAGRSLGECHLENSIVYVDSGSHDGSVEFARNLGCLVVCLDSTIPFTAARARNAGFKHLLQKKPVTKFVQFIDGDCTLEKNWLSTALDSISEQHDAAVVCGRRRELFPEKSIYNLLCDMEWDTPVGETNACGGDFLARRDALESVGAFCEELIAGEEPEMCYRLADKGWKIYRINCAMTAHDAAIDKFRQFWLRSKRSGHAYVERCTIHATRSSPYCVRPVVSIIVLGAILPLIIILTSIFSFKFAVALVLIYLILAVKISLAKYRKYKDIYAAFYYGLLTTVGKFAQFSGVLQFIYRRVHRSESRIIEYK